MRKLRDRIRTRDSWSWFCIVGLMLFGCASQPGASDWTPLAPAPVVYLLPADSSVEFSAADLASSFDDPRMPARMPSDGWIVLHGTIDQGVLVVSRRLERLIPEVRQTVVLAERSYRVSITDETRPEGRRITLNPVESRATQKSVIGSWDIPDLPPEVVRDRLLHASILMRCRIGSTMAPYNVHRRILASGPASMATMAGALGERDARQQYRDAFDVDPPSHGYREVLALPMGDGGRLQRTLVVITPREDGGSDVQLASRLNGDADSTGTDTVDLRRSGETVQLCSAEPDRTGYRITRGVKRTSRSTHRQ